VISNLAASVIQLATFFAIYGLEKIGPRGGSFGVTAPICLLPLVFAQVAILSLGTGLWLASLTAKYRDFTVLAGFLVQLWMYASPVIYPLSRVPARWYPLAALNPMAFPIEALRLMLLGGGSPSLPLGALSIALTLLAAGSGLIAFHRAEKTFIDVV
jgi:lipopolysaccharide transport system permease protein